MKFSSSAVVVITLMLVSQSALAAELDFAYSGEAGPERWSLLSPDNVLCNSGKKQSPIDIPQQEFKVNRLSLEQPQFDDAKDVKLFHDGHTVEVASSDESKPLPVQMKIKGKTFQLKEMHFHTPSEHRINGKYFDAEGHLVFTSKDKGSESTAVVAAFFKTGSEPNDFLKPITDEVPQKKGDERTIKELSFSKLQSMLGDLKEVYNYEGSLTTPPCTEGIQFFISRKIQPMDVTQLLGLRTAMGFSARPAQFRASLTSNVKLTKRRLDKKKRSNYEH